MGRVRLLGTAAVGAVVAVAAAILTTPFTEPLVPWLYDRLYRPIGPEAAVLGAKGLAVVATPLGMLLAVGVSGTVAAESSSDRWRVGALVGAQIVVAVACLAVGIVASLAVLVVVAADAVALAALAVRWSRTDAWASGTSLAAGSLPLVVLALAVLSLVGVVAVNSAVTATELGSAPVGDRVVDAPPAVEDAIESGRCNTYGSTGLEICSIAVQGSDGAAETRRFLDDHGVRCPMNGRAKSSVVVLVEGSYYRIECETV